MEQINIAELLKDCPKGMELDCLLCNNPIELEGVAGNEASYPIRAVGKDGFHHVFTAYGEPYNHDDAKCVIFPKGKTTWDGFVPPCRFKDGDILYAIDEGEEFIFILKHIDKADGRVYCYLSLKGDDLRIKEVWLTDYNTTHRLVTEEEKQKLFNAIKENGYKWNAETKTLDKLIESNEDVDDEILMSGIYFDRKYHADEVELHLGNYEIEIRDGRTYAVFKNQKNIEPYKE